MEWGPNSYQVQGCIMAKKEDAIESLRGGDKDDHSENEADEMFTFNHRHCTKMTGPGVTLNIAEETRSRDESTMVLTVGDWVLIDGDDEDEPIWLGRVMLNPDWGGQGVWKNETSRAKKCDNGAVIQRSQHGIYIMWYERIDIDSDELNYHVSRTITAPAVQRNEYTICTGFEMHRVVGDNNPVPWRRNTNKARRGQYDRIRQDI